jgi:tetratricopeptide (TPR) repeat protein
MAQRGFAAERDAVGSAEAQRDHSHVLIEMGDPARAEDMLRRSLTAAEYARRCELSAEIRGRLAELHAGRASTARRADQAREERAELRLAEDYLNDAITDGLACGESPALAGWYLALGRAVSRLDRLDEALARVERGRAILGRFGRWSALAGALVMVGQLQMARGNSVAALDALHEALDLAAELDDTEIKTQAADVLVRVYQIRARHVPGADQRFRDDTLDRAHITLAHLAEVGLDKQAAMLNNVIARLAV